jgi:ring-1,2-phenylacetyl-CoA epoxidase subunit PaaE
MTTTADLGTGAGTTSTAPQVGARSHAAFHPLRVAALGRLTDSALTITFEVPPELAPAYEFQPGQHLTLRTTIAGEEVRRSYSICTPPSSGLLQVAVKTLEGGVFSQHAHTGLRVGDVLDVMTPAGRFGVALDPLHAKHYVAIVAGSGITPVMSVLPAVLETEPLSSVTLVYGNRDSSSVMFAEELADLKDRFATRLHTLHVLSREPQDADLLFGRIDDAKLDTLLESVVPVDTVDEWLLCGPFELVQQVRERLVVSGVANANVHLELFHIDGEVPRIARPRSTSGDTGCQVTVRLDGRSTSFAMPDEGSVLDATLALRADAPFACKGGVCGTCRVKVVEGDVVMTRNYALEPEEVEAGFALACQSVPTSDRLVVDFDA